MFHPTSEFRMVGAVRQEEEEPTGESRSCSGSSIQHKAPSFHDNTQGRAAMQGLVLNATAAGCTTAPACLSSDRATLQWGQDTLTGCTCKG